MAEIYLDPMILVIAVAIVMSVVGLFDFLSMGKRVRAEQPLVTE